MISMSLGYPDFESELAMAKEIGGTDRLEQVQPVTGKKELLEMQHAVNEVYIHDNVYRYILQLITATRRQSCWERGASPRATIALVRMSRAAALAGGTGFRHAAGCGGAVPLCDAPPSAIEYIGRAWTTVSKGRLIQDCLDGVRMPPMGVRGR